jgi:basic membrane protein A and related proteins
VLLAGCGGKDKTAEKSGAPGGTDFRIAVVTDKGGINDQSFNASAWRGAQRAEKELGAKARVAESQEESDYATNLRSFAKQGYDVVYAIGYLEQEAYNQVSKEYPNTKFLIIDGESAGTPNAAGVKFLEQEGSFLAGALAAGMSKSGKIGFVGGMHGPVISRFENGYKAGAKTVNPNIQVFSTYTESWEDSGKGKEAALFQYGQGADVVFHAAGKCGLGVFAAVKDQPAGKWAIGVDSDQDHLVPGRILTSMVKRVDNAVFETTKSANAGTFKSGNQTFGLKEDGVGLSEMKYTKDKVPPALLKKVDGYKQDIIAGKIVVPGTDADYKAWAAKHSLTDYTPAGS